MAGGSSVPGRQPLEHWIKPAVFLFEEVQEAAVRTHRAQRMGRRKHHHRLAAAVAGRLRALPSGPASDIRTFSLGSGAPEDLLPVLDSMPFLA